MTKWLYAEATRACGERNKPTKCPGRPWWSMGGGCWCKYGRPTFGWKQAISEGLWKPKYNARHCLSLALHEKSRHLMAHGTSWSILEIMEYHGTSWKSMSQPGLSTPGNRYLGWVDERPAPKIYWWSRKHQETIRASDTCIWRNPEPFGIAEQGHSDDIDHRFTFHFPHHLSPWIHHWDLKKKKNALCIPHLNILCDIHEHLQYKRLTKEWKYNYEQENKGKTKTWIHVLCMYYNRSHHRSSRDDDHLNQLQHFACSAYHVDGDLKIWLDISI